MSTPPAEIPQTGPAAEELLVKIWVGNAIRTSGGTGPGWVQVPAREAGALIADRMASYRSPDDVLQAEIRRSSGRLAPRRASLWHCARLCLPARSALPPPPYSRRARARPGV